MRRAPSTDDGATVPAPPVVPVPGDFDPELGVCTVFLDVPREDVVFVHLVVESWEDFGVARTIERHRAEDRSRALMVVMVVPDFAAACGRALGRVCADTGSVRLATTPALREALRRNVLDDANAGSRRS